MINKLQMYIRDPRFRFSINSKYGLYRFFSDEWYAKRSYKVYNGGKLDLSNPKTYTEKLQWLMLYDRKPIYTRMVDKYDAKRLVADLIGEQYIIPTLGVWDDVEEIDFDKLPDRFVLKCTHDSGSYVICKDKSTLDISKAKKRLKPRLKRNYYHYCRQWPYKNVPPRIICEAYMEDDQDKELRDYKFFTFGGVPKVVYIAQGRNRGGDARADFFDMDFQHLDLMIDHEMSDIPPHKPQNFELMKELAAKLSKGTPQLRVDFYEVNGRVYFGELTFFHCGGHKNPRPDKWNELLGSWTVLPERTISD